MNPAAPVTRIVIVSRGFGYGAAQSRDYSR
jgi:hypothetical protein